MVTSFEQNGAAERESGRLSRPTAEACFAVELRAEAHPIDHCLSPGSGSLRQLQPLSAKIPLDLERQGEQTPQWAWQGPQRQTWISKLLQECRDYLSFSLKNTYSQVDGAG